MPHVEDSYELFQKAQWDEATQQGVAPQGAATWVWLANVDHFVLASVLTLTSPNRSPIRMAMAGAW